jgi:hypothetical protein
VDTQKLRLSIAVPPPPRIKYPSEVSDFVGYVECELPNPKLDAFVGRMTRMKTIGGRYKSVDKCALRDSLHMSKKHVL